MVFPIRGPHSPPVNFYFSVEHLMKVISYVRILALALAGAGAYAQPLPPGAVIVASGLDNPRGLRFGRGNQLFVAEAGTGGSNSTIGTCDAQVPFPLGPLRGGLTGRVTRLNPAGQKKTIASGLPSALSSDACRGRLRPSPAPRRAPPPRDPRRRGCIRLQVPTRRVRRSAWRPLRAAWM